MATKTITVCDICGTEKKEENGWFKAALTPTPTISVYAYEIQLKGCLDICGENCLIKWFSENISKLHSTQPKAANQTLQTKDDLDSSCLCNGRGCVKCCGPS